eukprot:407510-Amphidinium_carterae.1
MDRYGATPEGKAKCHQYRPIISHGLTAACSSCSSQWHASLPVSIFFWAQRSKGTHVAKL